jgi:hypothetical protein
LRNLPDSQFFEVTIAFRKTYRGFEAWLASRVFFAKRGGSMRAAEVCEEEASCPKHPILKMNNLAIAERPSFRNRQSSESAGRFAKLLARRDLADSLVFMPSEVGRRKGFRRGKRWRFAKLSSVLASGDSCASCRHSRKRLNR